MTNFKMSRLLRVITVFSFVCFVAAAAEAATKPKSHSSASTNAPKRNTVAQDPYLGAIVVDAASGRVLFEDHADAKGYPASVLKLMDLLIILEKIEAGQLKLEDQVPVSLKAAKTGGSQVWLETKETFTLDDMLYALMVRSANDVAVALAEKVGGSTDAFVELMNAKARALGMASTVLHSVHGLPPAKGQQDDVTTARDLSILCREVLKHPQALRYTSTRQRMFRPDAGKKSVNMVTHNHLLGHLDGCDGLKTGFIDKAGFSIAITSARSGQRVLTVVLDSLDRKRRDAKAAELTEKGFAALGTSKPVTAAPPQPGPAAKK